ncbi:armadillo/beta-catenin-like repeat-containing protein [Elsinoe australis]|uniref:Armadillo/beta-catenin-like repeat-containing protein n=1 Tax=Elsinoe australis TaxID=40998 RepID=A0A4U7B7M5_9PEZI|nr:armadillo/beta-catenin-like repeat-containing protein [Elsinoe australis]
MDTVLLESLRDIGNVLDTDTQISHLRRIKNDTVGHGLRKELVVTNGILAKLEDILATTAKAIGKRQEKGGPDQWTTDHEAQLQATLIIDTLANGGPAFVSPILLSNVVVHLFNNLVDAPARIIIASLRALNSLAISSSLSELSPSTTTPSPLVLQAFGKTNCQRLIRLLKSPLHSSEGRQLVDLTAGFIATACLDDHSRASLTKAGTLEALAALLADYALHDLKQAKSRSYGSQASHLSSRTVCKILNALSAIIRNSNYRSFRVLLASSLQRAFTGSAYSNDSNRYSRTDSGTNIDGLLPRILAPVQKSVSFGSPQFPSLHSVTDRFSSELTIGAVATMDPFCSWLIHLARSLDTPSSRLAALRLLALFNASFGLDQMGASNISKTRGRERQLGLLALPIAVKLVQDAVTTLNLPNDSSEDTKLLREEACAVLAMLIKTSGELQKAAVEAGAIKHVSLMLRKSFDPVGIARPMWSAQQKDSIASSNIPSAQMGDPALPSEIAHVMKVRAGALKALAAIAQREDTHRKAIIDQGMVNYVIDSLSPLPDEALSNFSSASVTCNFNTVPVLVAACEAAKSLSRSVSLLRTSLIDAGIAKPILTLLHHIDSDVQVAATSVCCNLVLDFSPMRQDLMDAGAIKIFTEHARRSNPALRVASLWALKHLVLGAPKDVRIEVLDELGPGWLVQAISGTPTSDIPSSSTPLGMSTSNALGEQVDLLNAPSTPEMDLDPPSPSSSSSSPPSVTYSPSGAPTQTSALRSTLKPNLAALHTLRTLRDRETNPLLQSRAEEADIQEQALDFVRNLINGDESASMLDHLNASIGLGRIFELIQTKLEPRDTTSARPRPAPPLSLASPSAAAAGKDAPPGPSDAIVHSAVNVIVHIAAASARYRQLVIAQKQLLRALLPFFGHRDGRIRVACLWLVINLTWVEDQSDREDARRRAVELRSLGIEERTRALHGDGELDVRERCKVAGRQMDELLVGAGRGR